MSINTFNTSVKLSIVLYIILIILFFYRYIKLKKKYPWKRKANIDLYQNYIFKYLFLGIILYLTIRIGLNQIYIKTPSFIDILDINMANPDNAYLRGPVAHKLIIYPVLFYFYIIIGVRFWFKKKYNFEKLFDETKSTIFKELKNFTVIDTETTGLGKNSRLIEFAAVKFRDGRPIKNYQTFVNPGVKIPKAATDINGITDKMVEKAPSEIQISKKIYSFIGNDILVGHNIKYDIDVLNRRLSKGINNKYVDTIPIFKQTLDLQNYKLETIKNHLNIKPPQTHRALDDVIMTYQCLLCINNPYEIWIKP